MRSWGMIMTFAYPEVDGKITQYMDFYMSSAVTKKMPESSSIDIQPADSDNFNAMITQQDGEMISQSLQMGMGTVGLSVWLAPRFYLTAHYE